MAFYGDLLAWPGMDLRVFRIEIPRELLAKKQAFLDVDVSVVQPTQASPDDRRPPGGPCVSGRPRRERLGSDVVPPRATVRCSHRGPSPPGSLELLRKVPERDPTPAEEALALAFRRTEQLDVEHQEYSPFSMRCRLRCLATSAILARPRSILHARGLASGISREVVCAGDTTPRSTTKGATQVQRSGAGTGPSVALRIIPGPRDGRPPLLTPSCSAPPAGPG